MQWMAPGNLLDNIQLPKWSTQMKLFSKNLMPRILLAANVLLVTNIVWAWVFVHFVHYHAQYHTLSPDDIMVEVATKEDLALLSNPDVREVRLSDGRTLLKSPAWDQLDMAGSYAATSDSDTFAKVTSKGTAIFARQWTQNTILLLIFAIPGLLLSVWNIRGTESASEPNVQK